MSIYEDKKLDERADQIRLLALHPASDPDSVVECSLEVCELSSPPQYEALSYVWGDESVTAPIRLENFAFEVTTNLHQALRRLRQPKEPRWLWVDAICIDQKRVMERNHQVRIMGRIYSLAKRVIVWLGEAEDDGHPAADMIRLWSTMSHEHLDNRPRHLSQIYRTAFEGKGWDAIHKMMKQPWWTRTWVYQEYVMAKAIQIMYGSAFVDEFECFLASFAWSQARKHAASLELSIQQVALLEGGLRGGRLMSLYNDRQDRMREPGDRLEKSDLLRLQNITHDLHSTDPRDKMYALLGLDDVRDIIVVVDYTKSVEDVYIDFTTACITSQRSLEILSFSGSGYDVSTPQQKLLMPSWVPDFRASAKRRRQIDERPTFADRSVAASFSISADKQCLICDGIVFDTLSSVIADAARDIFASDPFDSWNSEPPEHPPYPNAASRIQALFRTTISDKSSQDPGSAYVTTSAEQSGIWDSAFGFAYLFGMSAFSHLFDHSHIFRNVAHSIELARRTEMAALRFRTWADTVCASLTAQHLSANASPWTPEMAEGVTPKLPFPPDNTIHGLSPELARRYSLTYIIQLTRNLTDRSLFGTREGYMGLGPLHAQRGDQLCVIFGSPTPMILRPDAAGNHQVIGPCYVYGLMHGEMVDQWESGMRNLQRTTFRLV